MDPTGSSSRSSSPVAWRGATTRSTSGVAASDTGQRGGVAPDDVFDGILTDADLQAIAENDRRRRRRRWAAIGGVAFLFAAIVVTGAGGDDAAETPLDPPTDAPDPASGAGPDAAATPVDRPTLTLDPIEGGLRYGGMGGGADIRAEPSDAPFDRPGVAVRLPASIDPAWTVGIPIAASTAGVTRTVLSDVEIVVGPSAVMVVSPDGAGSITLTALDPDDGALRWRATLPGDSARLVGVAGGVVGVEAGPSGDRVLRLFDELDGTPIADATPRVAAAQAELAAQRVNERELDPRRVAERSIVASPGAGDEAVEMAAALAIGTATIIAADEVAIGRLVLLVGDDLVGVQTGDGTRFGDDDERPLRVDWVRPGVLLQSDPSERGALLLVSDRRGTQQQVVDAATGLVVTELSGLSSSVSVYTAALDGVIVKRPAPVGTSLHAVDLGGVTIWELVGSPPFGVGDGLLVTAAANPDALVVTGRR